MKTLFTKTLQWIMLMSLTACEYHGDDVNYVDFEKRDLALPDLIVPGVDLSQIIYCYGQTTLKYQLKAPAGTSIHDVKWSIDDQVIPHNEYDGGNAQLTIPDLFENPDKISQLTLSLSMNRPSGTLAEMNGWQVTANFQVKFIHPEKKLNIWQEVTDDGRLKVMWDDPSIDHFPVKNYSVYYYTINKSTNATLTTNRYIILDGYVAGTGKVYIKTTFENTDVGSWESEYTVIPPDLSGKAIKCEMVGYDKIRISVPDHIYACKYRVKVESSYYVPGYSYDQWKTFDQFPIEVDAPIYPATATISVELHAPDAANNAWSQYTYNATCNQPRENTNGSRVIFSTFDDLQYMFTASGIDIYKGGLKTKTGTLKGDYTTFGVDPNSTRKMVANGKTIYLFDNGQLTNPITKVLDYSVVPDKFGGDKIWYTADNRILMWVETGSDMQTLQYYHLIAIDSRTGELLCTYNLPDYSRTYSIVYATFSCDGKYVAFYGDYHIDIFELKGDQAKLVKSYDQFNHIYWFSCVFHPTIPNKLFICNDYAYCLDVTTQEMTTVADASYYMTDPISGNIITALFNAYTATTGDMLTIWDPSFTNNLYSIKCVAGNKYVYANTLLIFYNGYLYRRDLSNNINH